MSESLLKILSWAGIGVCITQSAVFSGLNLAFFSLTRLRLEIEAEAKNDKAARRILELRKDSNFLLTTILWGNVGINVLLTLLTENVLWAIWPFIFSTFVITIFGEVLPQAYFSRHALRMAGILSPLLRFYQFLLYPVAKPCALLLDAWLGKERVEFLQEETIKLFIKKHMEGHGSDISVIEGIGAINFLALDDLAVVQEGEDLNPLSIISLRKKNGAIQFPDFTSDRDHPFLKQVNQSEEKWVVITDEGNNPVLVLDADAFLRVNMFGRREENILNYCHVPIVITDPGQSLGHILQSLRQNNSEGSDEPIDEDVVLIWGDRKKIITGADLLGRLLKGI